MELVALTGKPKSGKTHLAKALEKQGYMLINFTDMLKDELSKVLAHYDVHLGIGDITQNKEKYRGILQELGSHIGFDVDGSWVERSIRDWNSDCSYTQARYGKPQPAVFDNVRTPQQWEVLKGYGFKLVRLTSSRSLTVWKPVGELFVTPSQHPIESALDHIQADLTLNGDLEVEYLVWKVLNS